MRHRCTASTATTCRGSGCSGRQPLQRRSWRRVSITVFLHLRGRSLRDRHRASSDSCTRAPALRCCSPRSTRDSGSTGGVPACSRRSHDRDLLPPLCGASSSEPAESIGGSPVPPQMEHPRPRIRYLRLPLLPARDRPGHPSDTCSTCKRLMPALESEFERHSRRSHRKLRVLHTPLSPDYLVDPGAFLAALTDFGPGRSKNVGNSADNYPNVHHRGASDADITEGWAAFGSRLPPRLVRSQSGWREGGHQRHWGRLSP